MKVIIEDPASRALEDLSLTEIEHVISRVEVSYARPRRDQRMRAFVIVKNVGCAGRRDRLATPSASSSHWRSCPRL
jgi:hypothetical protein